MPWEPIHKTAHAQAAVPNLWDYEEVRSSFTWDAARGELDGLPGGGLNIAYEAVDRHLTHGGGGNLAVRWLGKDDFVRDFRYRDLAELTNRFANVLKSLGIGKGDRVFVLLGRVPELYVVALGTLKNGSVFSPLFSAFGPEPVRARMEIGDARVLVTTEAFYRRKIAPWRNDMPGLRHVLLVSDPKCRPSAARWISLTRWRRPAPNSTSYGPSRKIWRCCISPAAPPVGPRAPSTSTRL